MPIRCPSALRQPRLTGRKVAALVACLLALQALPAAGGSVTGGDDAGSVAALAWRNEALRYRVELAAGDRYLLLLDPARELLLLTFRGAVLEQCPVRSAEVGQRRVSFISTAAPRWYGEGWSGGVVEPTRVFRRQEIVAPAPGSSEPVEVVVPPTPEEACPAPERFEIRFAGGLAVEIAAEETGEPAGGWRRALNGLRWSLRALAPRSRSASGGLLRIRLTIPPERLGALYRAMPDGVDFLVAPEP